MVKRSKIYLRCILSFKSDDLITFVDMNKKVYYYTNNVSHFLFNQGEFYEVSAKLMCIDADVIYMTNLRIYNTNSSLIERMFKIKNILDD